MDAVYIVRRGDTNEELRYSLRSIQNLRQVDRVWIAGYRPKWVTGTEYLYVPITTHNKWGNAKCNLRAAVQQRSRISETFVLMNDDFFVMQPVDEIPVLHRGSVAQMVRERTKPGERPSKYHNMAIETERVLRKWNVEEPYYTYSLHMPMVIEKAKMREVIERTGGRVGLHLRTLYGNFHKIGGDQARDRKNVVVDEPFLSSSDNGFGRLSIGEHVRASFPNPGPYEVVVTYKK